MRWLNVWLILAAAGRHKSNIGPTPRVNWDRTLYIHREEPGVNGKLLDKTIDQKICNLSPFLYNLRRATVK